MCLLSQRPQLGQPQNQQPAAPGGPGCGSDRRSVIGSIISVTIGVATSPKVATSDKGYTAPRFAAEEPGLCTPRRRFTSPPGSTASWLPSESAIRLRPSTKRRRRLWRGRWLIRPEAREALAHILAT